MYLETATDRQRSEVLRAASSLAGSEECLQTWRHKFSLSPNLEHVETEGVMLLYHVAESELPGDFYCHLATLGLLFIASPLLFPALERVMDVPAARGRSLGSLCFCLKLEA